MSEYMRRLLLGAGVIAGPVFILNFLISGAVRPGYSAWTMFVSQLATGDGGWVQTINFFWMGTLALAFVVGLVSMRVFAPALFLTIFAGALIVAGIFPTDPGLGYPPGAPEVHTTAGTVHGFAGLFVFLSNSFAALATALHFRADRAARALVLASLFTGVAILVIFFSMFTLGPDGPAGVFQRAAISVGFLWVAFFAHHMWRGLRAESRQGLVAKTAP